MDDTTINQTLQTSKQIPCQFLTNIFIYSIGVPSIFLYKSLHSNAYKKSRNVPKLQYSVRIHKFLLPSYVIPKN